MGGQSAFGTKAGDLFTRITIGVAAFWILLACFAVKYFGSGTHFDPTLGAQAPVASPAGAVTAPAEKPGEKAASKAADEPGKIARPAPPPTGMTRRSLESVAVKRPAIVSRERTRAARTPS